MDDEQGRKLQQELDSIMLKDKVLKEGDTRYAKKLTERIVFGILALFGTAVVMQLIKAIGLG